MTACPGCGAAGVGRLLGASRRRPEIGRCPSCGLVSVLEPPPAGQLAGLYDDPVEYDRYVAAQRTDGLRRRHVAVLGRLRALLPPAAEPLRLFDVGAGRGDFLDLARRHGFEVHGNELSAAAARLCRERHGIELTVGGFDEVPAGPGYDAMTMWCVLAHVPEPRELLAGALRLLRPGGVLYLHTPRWCLLDTAGLALSRVSRGRLGQVTDRRVNTAHLQLHGVPSLTALARTAGFDVLAVSPVTCWSLTAGAYLETMGVPAPVRRWAEPPLDRLVAGGGGVRNVLDAYLRRPPVRPAPTDSRAGAVACGGVSVL